MRQFCSILLLAIFVTYSFSNVLVVANFFANQNYIASHYCVNKDKPWMHCNGKCQLAKKMQEEENKDKQNSEHRSDIKTEAICTKYVPLQPKEIAQPISKCYPVLKEPIFYTFQANIFRPPRLS